MSTVNQIGIHHSGGLGKNNFASTLHLTPKDISRHHKSLWNFQSKYITDPAVKYAGYNVIYDPKDRSFTQCRAIGEQTIAIIGHNFNTFQLGIIGNYNSVGMIRFRSGVAENFNETVDPLTEQIELDVTGFLHDLMAGKLDLVIADDVSLDFSISRVYGHRVFSNTLCYGSGIKNEYFRDLLIKYKVVSVSPDPKDEEKEIADLAERVQILQKIIKLYIFIVNLLTQQKRRARALTVAAINDKYSTDREHEENFPDNF